MTYAAGNVVYYLHCCRGFIGKTNEYLCIVRQMEVINSTF
jgi:hypothetical protein